MELYLLMTELQSKPGATLGPMSNLTTWQDLEEELRANLDI